jgi:hypothetical protein
MFENLPARSVWICGYVPSRSALSVKLPKNPMVMVLSRHRKAPGSQDGGRLGRPDGGVLYVLCSWGETRYDSLLNLVLF